MTLRADAGEMYRVSRDLRAAMIRDRATVLRGITKITADTQRDAQSLCPVDTGFLRSSITREVADLGLRIVGETGPTAHYGRYVEEGTSRMGPQPYMTPAMDRNIGQLDALAMHLGVL